MVTNRQRTLMSAHHARVIPKPGFYEWKKLDAKNKQLFGFDLANGHMFGFAGMWDAWKDPKDGRRLWSYTILTTEANELMACVHQRMPVIRHPGDFDRWLSREETHQASIDLLRPFPADEMGTCEVSRDVSHQAPSVTEAKDAQAVRSWNKSTLAPRCVCSRKSGPNVPVCKLGFQ
jgi:putative SOS response-associated peptidase YedK